MWPVPTDPVEERNVPPTLQDVTQPLATEQAGLSDKLESSQQPDQAAALQQEAPAEGQGRQTALRVKDYGPQPASEDLRTAPGKPLQCSLACNR